MRLNKFRQPLFELLILLIITIPAYRALLNNLYFSMHDDQHIARLFLLDKGIRQGDLFPRWVDTLGFNFGYPLFNFYPPLVYYIGELFHLLGFSLTASIKLIFILGFFLAAVGIFFLAKKFIGRWPAFVAATLYTFFFYHAVLIYVRGALAEFFTLTTLPFVFLTLENLRQKQNLKNSILFGISFAALILNHPLIAFPALIFTGITIIYYFWQMKKQKADFLIHTVFGGMIGLALSAFFWLPSLIERKFTLVDAILTKELALYKIHFIYPQQFLSSLWGFGGSVAGPSDGLTFQLGKVHLIAVLGAAVLATVLFLRKRFMEKLSDFYFFLFLLLFSLFMTTPYSSFIWEKVSYLWYLQFPWRFLTFTALFISICGGYFIFFLTKVFRKKQEVLISVGLTIFLILATIGIYQKYFKPQALLNVTDVQRTTFDEIAWRISRTSFEFVPKGVATTKSDLGTTILDIQPEDIKKDSFEVVGGDAKVAILKNKMREKQFEVETNKQIAFRLNTFNFPGWVAYLNGARATIEDDNKYKLITVLVPPGKYNLKFAFKNTPIRIVADLISAVAVGGIGYYFLSRKFKKVKS